MAGKNIILIAGGEAKGQSFEALNKAVKETCRQVILIGAATTEIAENLPSETAAVFADSMDAAVEMGASLAKPAMLFCCHLPVQASTCSTTISNEVIASARLFSVSLMRWSYDGCAEQSSQRIATLLMAAALIAVGLVAIASASISLSEVRFGNEWHHAIRHMMYLGAGIVFRSVAYLVPVAAWRNLSPWLLLLALALLV